MRDGGRAGDAPEFPMGIFMDEAKSADVFGQTPQKVWSRHVLQVLPSSANYREPRDQRERPCASGHEGSLACNDH